MTVMNNPPTGTNTNIGEAVAKANETVRVKSKVSKPSIVPTELAPRWELIVNESAKRLKAKQDMIKKVIGERPYKGIPIDENELEIRYTQMRDDPDLHKEALKPNLIKTKDGRVLVNKEYIQALINIESKIRKGVIST